MTMVCPLSNLVSLSVCFLTWTCRLPDLVSLRHDLVCLLPVLVSLFYNLNKPASWFGQVYAMAWSGTMHELFCSVYSLNCTFTCFSYFLTWLVYSLAVSVCLPPSVSPMTCFLTWSVCSLTKSVCALTWSVCCASHSERMQSVGFRLVV